MQKIKQYFRKIFHTPILLAFVLLCLTLLPPSVNLRSLAFRSAIVVAMGIDLDDENMFVLDAAITVPSTGDNLSETDKVLTAKGSSFSDALANMNIMFGKTIKLGHTKFIIIGKKISGENLATSIDGVIRTNKVRDSVQLVLCEDSVHDLFKVGSKLKTNTGIKLSDILCYNEQYSTTSLDSNVDSFYKGYFSRNKISKINSIRLTDDHTRGVAPTYEAGPEQGEKQEQTGQTQNGEEAQNDSGQLKFISNEGRVAVYKDGRLEEILPTQIAEGANWIDSSHLPKKLIVATNNAENIKEISFEVLKKSLKIQSFFEKEIPFISISLNLTLDIIELINSGKTIIKSRTLVQGELKGEISKEIRRQIGDALNYAKKTKLDFLDFNDVFYLNNNKEYNDFLKKGSTVEDFAEKVQLSVEVNVKIV